MQTEFRAIAQSEYGAPEKVLRIAKRQLNGEELGADDVLVRVAGRPSSPERQNQGHRCARPLRDLGHVASRSGTSPPNGAGSRMIIL